jgi:hypothetical protein
MSCLALSELPLSEQIEIQLAFAARLERETREFLATRDRLASLDPSAPPPASPPVPALSGGSFLFNARPAVPCPPSLLPVETAGAGTSSESSHAA